MRNLHGGFAPLLAGAVLVTGCSGQGLSEGEVGALLNSHPVFSLPVGLELPIERGGDLIFQNGIVGGVSRQCVGAKLVEAGTVKIEPDASGGPWWKIAGVGDELVLGIGTREITKHSEKRRWKEGATRYYSETITYKLVGPQILPNRFPSTYGPFSFRLVAVNDPRNGRWQLDTGQTVIDTQAEYAAFGAPLLASGDCSLDASSRAVADAQRRAMDEIEASLARDGNLARGPAPGTLINSNAKLAYYAVRKDFDDSRTFAAAEAYCRSVKVPGFGTWRIPNMAELNTVRADKFIRDVPDHRLWGQVFALNPGMIAAVYAANDGMNSPRVNYPFRWMQVLRVGTSGTTEWTIQAVTDNDRPFGGEGGTRVLCVTDWPRK